MRFRVIQSYSGDYVIQYKAWFLWKNIQRAWIHKGFYPDYVNESFKDFNEAVAFCRSMNKTNLKTYIDKQKTLFKQGILSRSQEIKSEPPINTKLSFEFESTDTK